MSRAVVVTGAAGAIGAALCRVFRSQGCRIIGVDLEPAPEADHSVAADLGAATLDEALRAIRAALGGEALHALVNNAAIQVVKPVEALDESDWRRTLAVNLLAPFLLTRGLLGELERSRGSVVNIASVHARLSKPGFAAYATSKAALEALTRSLAVELGARVRVNAVSPAAVDTPMLRAGFADPGALAALARMHPSGRVATPEEVARAAAFLASEAASAITGAVLALDGGIGARLHDPA
jgi:NAD(P)-dependent dehydrogenase (short-subunit alcohol dehydrogenase family)